MPSMLSRRGIATAWANETAGPPDGDGATLEVSSGLTSWELAFAVSWEGPFLVQASQHPL